MFTLTSFMLPFSPNEAVLYAARSLQGISVAAAVPSAIGILSSTFSASEQRQYAFIIYSATGSLGGLTGNIIGGVIGGSLSWKWVFWCAAIIGSVVCILALVLVPSDDQPGLQPDQPPQHTYVDWTGGVLITASMMTLLIVLSQATSYQMYQTCVLFTLSGVLFSCFIIWEKHLEKDPTRRPLIKLSLFKDMRFSAALVTYGCYLSSFCTFLIYSSLL